MGGKKTVAAEIDEDTELYQQLEEFEEDFGSRSEAIRAALRAGLQDQKWVRFGEFLSVTSWAAAFILGFAFLITAGATLLGHALAVPPGMLAVLATAGVFVAVLSKPITAFVRWADAQASRILGAPGWGQ